MVNKTQYKDALQQRLYEMEQENASSSLQTKESGLVSRIKNIFKSDKPIPENRNIEEVRQDKGKYVLPEGLFKRTETRGNNRYIITDGPDFYGDNFLAVDSEDDYTHWIRTYERPQKDWIGLDSFEYDTVLKSGDREYLYNKGEFTGLNRRVKSVSMGGITYSTDTFALSEAELQKSNFLIMIAEEKTRRSLVNRNLKGGNE